MTITSCMVTTNERDGLRGLPCVTSHVSKGRDGLRGLPCVTSHVSKGLQRKRMDNVDIPLQKLTPQKVPTLIASFQSCNSTEAPVQKPDESTFGNNMRMHDKREPNNISETNYPVVSYSDSDIRGKEVSSLVPPKTPSENDLASIDLQPLLLWKVNEYIASANALKSINGEDKQPFTMYKRRSRRESTKPSSSSVPERSSSSVYKSSSPAVSRVKPRKRTRAPNKPPSEQNNPTYKMMSRRAHFPDCVLQLSFEFVLSILNEHSRLFDEWFSKNSGELPTPLTNFIIECSTSDHGFAITKQPTRHEGRMIKSVGQMGRANQGTLVQSNKSHSGHDTCCSTLFVLDKGYDVLMDVDFCQDFCKGQGINLEEEMFDIAVDPMDTEP